MAQVFGKPIDHYRWVPQVLAVEDLGYHELFPTKITITTAKRLSPSHPPKSQSQDNQSIEPISSGLQKSREIDMTVQQQIKTYIASQPEPKQGELAGGPGLWEAD